VIIGKPIDTTQFTEKDKDLLLQKVQNTIGTNISRYAENMS
jgi:hypothetical protein